MNCQLLCFLCFVIHSKQALNLDNKKCPACGDYLRVNYTCFQEFLKSREGLHPDNHCPIEDSLSMTLFRHYLSDRFAIQDKWVEMKASEQLTTSCSNKFFQFNSTEDIWEDSPVEQCNVKKNPQTGPYFKILHLKIKKNPFAFLSLNDGNFSCYLKIAAALLEDWDTCSVVLPDDAELFSSTEFEMAEPHFTTKLHYSSKNKNYSFGQNLAQSNASLAVSKSFVLFFNENAPGEIGIALMNASLSYGISLDCAFVCPYGFRLNTYPYYLKNANKPEHMMPRNLTTNILRVYPNSTVQLSLLWTCPVSWNGFPGEFEVVCVILDMQYPNYIIECYSCFGMKNTTHCSACWEDILFEEPLASTGQLVPYFQTHIDLEWRINFNIEFFDNFFDDMYDEQDLVGPMLMYKMGNIFSHRHGINLHSKPLNTYMTHSMAVPSEEHGITKLTDSGMKNIRAICRAKCEASEIIKTEWTTPLLLDFGKTELATQLAIVTATKGVTHDKITCSRIWLDKSTGSFFANESHIISKDNNFIPAIGISDGGKFIQLLEASFGTQGTQQQVKGRISCFHISLKTWFAFIPAEDNNLSFELALYSLKNDVIDFEYGFDMYFEELSWTRLRIYSQRPFCLKCAAFQGLLAWTEESSSTIELAKIQWTNTGHLAVKKQQILNLCNKDETISSAYFDFYYASVHNEKSLTIIGACGQSCCISHLNEKQLFDLHHCEKLNDKDVNFITADSMGFRYFTIIGSNVLRMHLANSTTSSIFHDFNVVSEELIHDLESFPGYKDKVVIRHNLEENTTILALSAVQDRQCLPVPPFECLFPTFEIDTFKPKGPRDVSVVLKIANASTKCTHLIPPRLKITVESGTISEDGANTMGMCLRCMGNQSLYYFEKWNCSTKCDLCNTNAAECRKTTYSSLSFTHTGRALLKGSLHHVEVCIEPYLDKNTRELWYQGRKAHSHEFLYLHNYEEGLSNIQIMLLILIPFILIILILGGVIAWFYKKHRWYLLTNLNRIDFKDIQKQNKIGEGYFGEVWKADLILHAKVIDFNKRRKTVVVKLLKESATEKDQRTFREEAILLSKLDCEYVVKPLGICLQSRPIMLLMEHMDGGALLDYLHKDDIKQILTVQNLCSIIHDILEACVYLETEGIVHRDIAARNCLLQVLHHNDKPKIAKLADFGLAKDVGEVSIYREGSSEQQALPYAWSAPECFNNKFSIKSDVWAFGVLMWEILSFGCHPYSVCNEESDGHHQCSFTDFDYEQVEFAVCVKQQNLGSFKDPCGDNFPESLKALMLMCWIYGPEDRPSFRKLQKYLAKIVKEEHSPWSTSFLESHKEDCSPRIKEKNPILLKGLSLATTSYDIKEKIFQKKSPLPQSSNSSSCEGNDMGMKKHFMRPAYGNKIVPVNADHSISEDSCQPAAFNTLELKVYDKEEDIRKKPITDNETSVSLNL